MPKRTFTAEALKRRREADKLRKQRKRSSETMEEREKRRISNAETQRKRRLAQTAEEAEALRAKNREFQRKKRSNGTIKKRESKKICDIIYNERSSSEEQSQYDYNMASKKKSTEDSKGSDSPKVSPRIKGLSNGTVLKDSSDSSVDNSNTSNDFTENGLSANGLTQSDNAQKECEDSNSIVDGIKDEDKNINGKNFHTEEHRKKVTRSTSKEKKKQANNSEVAKDTTEKSNLQQAFVAHLNSNFDGENNCDKEQKKSMNVSTDNFCDSVEEIGSSNSKIPSNITDIDPKNPIVCADNSTDDIEIIGESKIVQVSTNNTLLTQNVVFVPAALTGSVTSHGVTQGFTATHSSLLSNSSLQNPVVVQGFANAKSLPVQSLAPNFLTSGHTMPGTYSFNSGIPGKAPQGISLLTPTIAPPKPKSSLDQIELIRWEIQNRVNTRPKYFKPNSSSELGPLAKFLFDIGSDLIKEAVYHDLVKMQSKKGEEEKLSDKEKDDLEKLKSIEKDLYATIGHLKLKLKKHCKGCNYQSESENVMFLHKQFPHEDGKNLRCAHCSFSTRQAMSFKFHMEAEHNLQPRLPEKRAFYECDLCPYENNQEQKLIIHKQRCVKQFRPLFNLHPGCLSGAEINLCLENIFYKPIVPKNIKILQQKHAQQQAALAEARRQQAQVQALAAQKNAAAIAAKKLQQQPRPPATVNGPILQNIRMPVTKATGQQHISRFSNPAKTPRPTVANLLNSRQNQNATQSIGPGGFEVCEICGGYVKDRKALRIHFFYAHRIDLPFNLFERDQAPLYCATCYVRFWTAQGLRKHIETHKGETQTRGVFGKCISCFEHVTNLLLHMRMVHNRELQHYLNALMCMFCGGHFGTRQECERHIIRAHGIIDPLTGAIKPSANISQPSQSKPAVNQKKTSGGNALVKGSICVLCNLNFGRNVDLTRHCMRMHHTCMKCGMVVIDKASLLKHTCLSSPSGTRDCCMCPETGFHPAYYVKHLRDKHLKKFSVKIHKLSKSVIERWTKRPFDVHDSEEVLVEISDSDDDNKKNKSSISPAKKYKMGPACKVSKFNLNFLKAASEVVKIDDDSNDDDVVLEKVELAVDTKSPNKRESTSNDNNEKCVKSKDSDDTTMEASKEMEAPSSKETPYVETGDTDVISEVTVKGPGHNSGINATSNESNEMSKVSEEDASTTLGNIKDNNLSSDSEDKEDKKHSQKRKISEESVEATEQTKGKKTKKYKSAAL